MINILKLRKLQREKQAKNAAESSNAEQENQILNNETEPNALPAEEQQIQAAEPAREFEIIEDTDEAQAVPEAIEEEIIPEPEAIEEEIIPEPEAIEEEILPEPEAIVEEIIPEPEAIVEETASEPEAALAGEVDREEEFRQKLMEELMQLPDEPAPLDEEIIMEFETEENPDEAPAGGTDEFIASPEPGIAHEQASEKIPESPIEISEEAAELLEAVFDAEKEIEPEFTQEITPADIVEPEPVIMENKEIIPPRETIEPVSEKARKQGMESIIQLVGFDLANEFYGVDIQMVKEINRMSEITKVPYAPEFVEGVINLRGSVIPVINLRKKVHMPQKEADKDTRIIVLEISGRTIGFIVDAVREVLRIHENLLMPPPGLTVGKGADYITSIAKLPDKLVILLDPEKLLTKDDTNFFMRQN